MSFVMYQEVTLPLSDILGSFRELYKKSQKPLKEKILIEKQRCLNFS